MELKEAMDKVIKMYEQELDLLLGKKLLTKKTRGDLLAGFLDGVRAGIRVERFIQGHEDTL